MEEVQAKQKKELKTFESNKRIALKKIKGTAGKGKKGKEALAQGEAEWKETLQQLILQHDQQLKSLLGDGTSNSNITSNSNSISNSSGAAADGGANPSPADQDQDHDDTMNNTKTHNTDKNTNANTGKEKEEDQQRAIREKALDKKMRKKKNALAKQKAREEQIAKEMAEAPNPRQMEIDAIMELYLQGAKLEIEEVRADGNCLYRAIAKQMELMMKIRNGGGGKLVEEEEEEEETFDFMKVREICAQELWEKKEEYEPFADLEEVKVETFEGYVDKVRDSSEWGGHLELRALAQKLSRTIVVYSTEGPLEIEGGNGSSSGTSGSGEGVIRLSFHRQYYALGEHYNSVVASSE